MPTLYADATWGRPVNLPVTRPLTPSAGALIVIVIAPRAAADGDADTVAFAVRLGVAVADAAGGAGGAGGGAGVGVVRRLTMQNMPSTMGRMSTAWAGGAFMVAGMTHAAMLGAVYVSQGNLQRSGRRQRRVSGNVRVRAALLAVDPRLRLTSPC